MVITDIESGFLSREASGRFQLSTASRRTLQQPATLGEADHLLIDLQNARARAQALVAVHRVFNSIN